MIKKAVLFAVLLVALSFGSAFADQIDALASGNINAGPVSLTNVFVNPGGTGDALIYGYYNVRDNRSNFFTVVNTASYGVRARIRFLEAADATEEKAENSCNGSWEVLDFDICLSAHDEWSGEIRKVGAKGVLFSTDSDTALDLSCPRGSSMAKSFADKYPNGLPFHTADNPIKISDDMSLEGYFFVIAENQLAEVTSGGNCGTDQVDVPRLDVDNVLFGNNYAVDMDTLATFGYDATALGYFALDPFSFSFVCPTSAQPNLGSATDGLGAVNYALTKSNLYSIYDLESDIAAKTSLVVTFPTKQLTHTCSPLTDDIFDDPRVHVTVWDDKEQSIQTHCETSPCPPTGEFVLPHEVNVVNVGPSGDIFTTTVGVDLPTSGFVFGWLDFDLVTVDGSTLPSPNHQTACQATAVFPNVSCRTDGTFPLGYTQSSQGLPAIGYTALDVAGGASTHMLPVQYKSTIATQLQVVGAQ